MIIHLEKRAFIVFPRNYDYNSLKIIMSIFRQVLLTPGDTSIYSE